MTILHLLVCAFCFVSTILMCAISATLASCWFRFWKHHPVIGCAGRVVLWGGGLTNAAFTAGMDTEAAIILFLTSVSCLIFPAKKYIETNNIFDIVFNTFDICLLAVISLLPMMVILWLNHYAWYVLLVCSFCLPLIYNLGSYLNVEKVYTNKYKYIMIEFIYGSIIGFCLYLSVNNRVITMFPPLPSNIFTIAF